MSLSALDLIKKEKLIAVIRYNSYEEAKKAIETCIKGGIKIIEITLTTPEALKLIKEFSKSKVLIGAGTVVSHEDAYKSVKSGAKFLVSPHFSDSVNEVSQISEIPYLAGVMTPTEAISAYRQGSKLLKVFPSEIVGPNFISGLLKPFPFLELMPSGGVNLDNAAAWLKSGAKAISVGSNLLAGQSEKEKLESIKKYLKIVNG
ncbi:bifunctional 4-hydroxy-2-oxoglutarate aldolase/2-dehydro-3-deoxy-phosphogluconate aldolase [Mycoplasmopsis fermentans]|uniref:2-dehydro-3-deoxyphosphogluconate aldolase n=2 Tax=Mycoplasmopsis fermentans TaxID=2115 RepID=C4XDT0_MYCFP|nr:bifunctional 4-hydroxy-2-oxoglutarate aldolase/2-dehydro-3-deoxy-phosphogluconate aldolase [Mycoplasmopsis fermentans]VEU67092.1 2-dehydro-3-deoxy-phosphogluconate aldolase [Mesomycoplasma conjunctivae]ADN69071.1 2-dehydro-3-deoxy-phosphogluconate aldolase [Mycoplasmopsis fermentans JER]ADV34610.1 2-dehydro-3-deoxyphosphogluconate aldolase/4-hydroxy-2-oxoglutarate aldolase [Mycoplasmopsis fermentans M64]VEU63918.1 2-dehydro-3-deoxy-phosphogluconate aldolase [Mycoplasmopsis fermentans]BAH693